MHLVAKNVKGHEYFYLVEKAWRDGKVVTARTIYLGNRQKLAGMLQTGLTAALPQHFEQQEIGATLALWQTARSLEMEELIDKALPARAGAGQVGRRLVIAAVHRVLAPRRKKSKAHLREYYERSALSELAPVDAASLDVRRVCELLASLAPKEVEAIEAAVVQRLVEVEKLELKGLAFDTTNFDSYAGASTKSKLLERGHNKSGKPLRAMGLGLLVTEEDGLPLLTFAYPGNENDATAFKRFLRALDRRRASLPLPFEHTVVADGGNIAKQQLLKLEKDARYFVMRLPARHAPALDRMPRKDLEPLGGKLKGKVFAKKHRVNVYGVERTVVDVFTKRMRDKQLPGLRRDQKKVRTELATLQKALDRQRAGTRRGKPLSLAQVKQKVAEALSREHMKALFAVTVRRATKAPELDVREKPEGWAHLEEHVLGRTLLVTNRRDWAPEQIVLAARMQSHDESFFRDLKDPSYVSMLPLRHRKDSALRAHALVVVLGLLLARLALRRARKANAPAKTVGALLELLSAVTRARWTPRDDAAPALKSLARRSWVPSKHTADQDAALAALGLIASPELGTSTSIAPARARRGRARAGVAKAGNSR